MAVSIIEDTNPLENNPPSATEALGVTENTPTTVLEEMSVPEETPVDEETVVNNKDSMASQDDDGLIRLTYPDSNKNVTIDKEVYKSYENNFISRTPAAYIPNGSFNDYQFYSMVMNQKLLQENPSYDGDREGLTHDFGVYNSMRNTLGGNQFEDALQREGSDWQQTLTFNGVPYRSMRPTFGNNKKATRLTGAEAIVAIQKFANTGSHLQTPLVHSGIWLRFKPISNLEYLDLIDKINLEKEVMGHNTLGMVYHNDAVYRNKHFIDFALEHVIDCSLEGWTVDLLRETILITDMQLIAAALGYVMYPSGVDYASPCIATQGCNHVFQGKLKLLNCILYDRARFSNSQNDFMSDVTAKRTLEEVKAYQKQYSHGNHFTHSTGLEIYMKVPTLSEHIASGYRWVKDIVRAIDDSFGKGVEGTARNNIIRSRVEATTVRNFSHFVSNIVIDSDKNFVDKPEDIDKLLPELMNIEGFTSDFITNIRKFIDENTFGLVGIPRWTCTSCGKPSPENQKNHPYIIPIDMVNLFFALGDARFQNGSLSSMDD